MILVDTSIWIDHLRSYEATLAGILNAGQIMIHPFVIGELACGALQRRTEVLSLLRNLPQASVASDDEVLFFIERHRLMGLCIGYIDAHLLASAFLTPITLLWTRDKRLVGVAQRLTLSFIPNG